MALKIHPYLRIVSQNSPENETLSQLEKRLLKIVESVSENSYNAIVFKEREPFLMRELFSDRTNALHWFPLKKSMRVLEMGAGYGALTGSIADTVQEITSYDRSLSKTYLNNIRNRNHSNIRYLSGDFNWLLSHLLGEKFDAIFLNGGLSAIADAAQNSEEFRKVWDRLILLLEAQGAVFILTDNPDGLKKKAGVPAPESLDKMESTDTNLHPDITKEEYQKLFEESGFADVHWSYPYPDFYFIKTIFTDKSLPKQGELNQNAFSWEGAHTQAFDQSAEWDRLIKEIRFAEFANSYLISAAKEAYSNCGASDWHPVRSSFAVNRSIDKKIRTDHLQNGNREKRLRKTALFPAGISHIERIESIYHQLKQVRSDRAISINHCERSGEALYFDYIDGVALDSLMRQKLVDQDDEGFLSLFNDYLQLIFGSDPKPFKAGDEFRKVFGNFLLSDSLHVATFSNLDLISTNIMVRDHEWVMIDYEWTLPFPLPAEYVAFRAVYYFWEANHQFTEQRAKLEPRMLKMAGVGDRRKTFLKMEMNFQNNYVGNVNQEVLFFVSRHRPIDKVRLFVKKIVKKEA